MTSILWHEAPVNDQNEHNDLSCKVHHYYVWHKVTGSRGNVKMGSYDNRTDTGS